MEDFFYINIGELFEFEGDLLVKIKPFISDYDGGYYTAYCIASATPACVNKHFIIYDNTCVRKIKNFAEWKNRG